MIEALIGSIIAVIATGALALMAEVFTAAQGGYDQRNLSEYERLVVNVVLSAHEATPEKMESEPGSINEWLKENWRQGL